MELEKQNSIFEMEMDPEAIRRLQAIAKWTRFISITIFLVAIIGLVIAIVAGNRILERMDIAAEISAEDAQTVVVVGVALAMIVLVVWVLFLFRASNHIRNGLANKNSDQIAEGFRAIRIFFIISSVFSVLAILGTLTGM